MINYYVDTDVSPGGDGSSGSPYASLSEGIVARAGVLTDAITFNCSGSAVDSSGVHVTGYTVTTSYYITIKTLSTDRHDGTVSGTGCYHRKMNSDVDDLRVGEKYTVIDGIKFEGYSGIAYESCIVMDSGVGIESVVKNNLIHNWGITSSSWNNAIDLGTGNGSFRDGECFNNIVIAASTVSNRTRGGINAYGQDYDDYLIANNTVIGFDSTGAYGIGAGGDASHHKGKVWNNLSYDNTTDFYIDNLADTDGSGNNFSKDDTAPGSNSIHGTTDSKTPDFVSTTAGSEDLHLQSTSDAIDVGYTRSEFSVDIDGDTRGSSWDIGADEYITSGGSKVPVFWHHFNQLRRG